MTILPELPRQQTCWPSEPWRDVTQVWWHTWPHQGQVWVAFSCDGDITLWLPCSLLGMGRREPSCCVITGTQGQADSRLLLPWRDAGKSEVIIQLSDPSPTSCLRIPAHFSHSHGWSVIYIASGQSQYVVKSQILIWMYLFRFSWSLSLSVITSVKRQTETKLKLLGPEGNIGLKLSR